MNKKMTPRHNAALAREDTRFIELRMKNLYSKCDAGTNANLRLRSLEILNFPQDFLRNMIMCCHGNVRLVSTHSNGCALISLRTCASVIL